MEKSRNYGFYLPSSNADDIVEVNQLSENFKIIDTEMSEMLKGKGVDQNYKPDSSNPQSGKAIAGALIPYLSVNDNMEWVFDGGNSLSNVDIEFTLDDEVSNSSMNPITNRAITQYVNGKTIDYIVEQGVTDNGIYRKWNSGIAECWKRVNVSGIARNVKTNEIFYTSQIMLGNFPSGLFKETPYICDISLQNPEFSSFIETGAVPTTKDFAGSVYLGSAVSKESMYATICVYAMGYWK